MARSGRLNIGSTRLRHLSEAVLAACDLPADGSAAVALSGGADSSVCAWASGRSGRPVRALHVHHGLPASDTLAAAAEAVASRLGLSITVLRVAVPDGSSFEARARDLRYAAMEAAMDDEEWLLTGHTADDQAETVLINLLRGAGIDGLAGIPARRGRVARPLLGVTRAETRELATLLELPWLDDPANLDPHPLRNRVRRDLLPALEAGYRPGLSAALARMAGRAGAEAAHLQEQADRLTLDLCPAGARLAAAELVTFPGVVAARAIRAALRAVRPPYAGTAEEVALVQGVAVGETSHARLPGGLVARRRGPWVELTAATEPAVPGEPVTWALPGA
ncbi:MAG: tRNA lysidine(34) synthetase TilS, partial [Acidimicrobiia bacterium]